MLPSFRLIAATFLCGFVVMFASLRLATSLNGLYETLPVVAVRAAPPDMVPPADLDVRRGAATIPVMYDLRFAVSTASFAPMLSGLAIPAVHRAAPTALPPATVQLAVDRAVLALAAPQAEFTAREEVVAALQPTTMVDATPFEPAAATARDVVSSAGDVVADTVQDEVVGAVTAPSDTPADGTDARSASPVGVESVASVVPGLSAAVTTESSPEPSAVEPAAAGPMSVKPVAVALVSPRKGPEPRTVLAPEVASRAVLQPRGVPDTPVAAAPVVAVDARPAGAAATIQPAATKPVEVAAFELPASSVTAADSTNPAPSRLVLDPPVTVLRDVPLPRPRPAPHAKVKSASANIKPNSGSRGSTRPVAAHAKPAPSQAARARAAAPETSPFPFGGLVPPPPLPFGLP